MHVRMVVSRFREALLSASEVLAVFLELFCGMLIFFFRFVARFEKHMGISVVVVRDSEVQSECGVGDDICVSNALVDPLLRPFLLPYVLPSQICCVI
jgi:hypothetical protein